MTTDYDALIVGAGFSGLYMLKKLRALGMTVKVVEMGADSGGVWWWNNYPGARVDSPYTIYQFSDPALYTDFQFTEKYPDRNEIRDYIQHMEKKLGLRQFIQFNTKVTRAQFQEDKNVWAVSTSDGATTTAKWLLLGTGFAAKPYTPPFKGLDRFQGQVYHTSKWPKDKAVDFKGKRVAVIGTGASGVQVIQTVGPQAEQLYVYQRTPNLALPMRQEALQVPNKVEGIYPEIFQTRLNTFGGMPYDFVAKNALETSEEERNAFYKGLFEQGGFAFWLNIYQDVLFHPDANETAYNFWRDQVRSRISDPEKQELMAPKNPPHPWGTKRPSLEQNYYEVISQPNVKVIDVNASPILEIREKGVVTEKEGELDVDIIVLATGFDAVTGSMLKIDLVGRGGLTIQEKWGGEKGTRTALGLAISGFPNMFFFYGPQAPTAFSNGHTCIEVQGDFVSQLMEDKRLVSAEATEDSEEIWGEKNSTLWKVGLFSHAKSWYQGSNIPGKRVEPLNFSGGIPLYRKELEDCKENGYSSFKLVY